MVLKPAFLIASLLMGSTAAARPHIYTYVDEDGMRHYTDVPDNNRYRLLTLSPQERTASGDRYDSMLLAKAGRYDSIIETAARSASLEPDLLRAVIVVESGFNSRAVSKRGAVGLMQLMPATATRFGVSNPYDPRENVHAGARYLKFLIDRFGHDLARARGVQRGRSGGRPQRSPNSALHRDDGLRASRAQDLPDAPGSAPRVRRRVTACAPPAASRRFPPLRNARRAAACRHR